MMCKSCPFQKINKKSYCTLYDILCKDAFSTCTFRLKRPLQGWCNVYLYRDAHEKKRKVNLSRIFLSLDSDLLKRAQKHCNALGITISKLIQNKLIECIWESEK